MVVECVIGYNLWNNYFPPCDGIHLNLSPRAIITGHTILYEPVMKLEFVEYAQVATEGDNIMRPKAVVCIALQPSGTIQGGARYFSLNTGRVILDRSWVILPTTRDMADRVHQPVRRAKTSKMMGLIHDGGEAGEETGRSDDDGYDPVYKSQNPSDTDSQWSAEGSED